MVLLSKLFFVFVILYSYFCCLSYICFHPSASSTVPPLWPIPPPLIPNCWNSWGWATLLHQLRSQSKWTLCICICMRWNIIFPEEPKKNMFRIEVVSPFPTSPNSWLVTWWATPLRQLRSQSNKCPVNQLIVKKYKRCLRFFLEITYFLPQFKQLPCLSLLCIPIFLT